MSSTSSLESASDQASVAVSFNPGESLAQEFPTEVVCIMAKFLIVHSVFQRQQSTSSTEGHGLRNLKGLLTATQVCRKWRNAILNDARLWTEIDFTVQGACDVEAFTRVLGLSKRLSLHMRIDFGEHSVAGEVALDQLLDVSSRCASLDLNIPHQIFVRLVNERPRFPILRRLFHTPIGDTSSEVVNGGCAFWECVPALEVLRIHDGAAWQLPFEVKPWLLRSLKKLEIVIKSDPLLQCANLFLGFVRESKIISHITFDVLYPLRRQWVAPGLTVNTSGSLKTLYLKHDAFRLLPYIGLPGLQALWVDRSGSLDTPAWNAIPNIIGLIERSNPPLTSFFFLAVGETDLSIMPSMLASMPHLKRFELHCNLNGERQYVTDLFDKLAKNENGAFEVLPKLETLIIHFHVAMEPNRDTATVVVDEVDRDHFVEMIRARTGYPDLRLRLVKVIVDGNGLCNLDESDLGVLQEYERRVERLKIVIRDARHRDV